jgi:hypothetical protein
LRRSWVSSETAVLSEPEMKLESPHQSAHIQLSRRVAEAARVVLCLALLMTIRGRSQNAPGPSPHNPAQPIGLPPGSGLDDSPTGDSVEEVRRLRALNADRQKSMVADANKLLSLVNELNAEIARDNPDTLDPEQLHKVAEIEKLAHSVKDKMSISVRGTAPFQMPPLPRR